MSLIARNALPPGWQLFALTGDAEYERVRARSPISARARPYLDDMADAYAAADLLLRVPALRRSASWPRSENPSILVPYPYAAQAHQAANAARFEAAGAAVVLTDRELAGRRSAALLARTRAPQRLQQLAERAAQRSQETTRSRDSRPDRCSWFAKRTMRDGLSLRRHRRHRHECDRAHSAGARRAVSGSDSRVTPLVEQLRAEGARVTIGHDARNVRDADAVIVSSAIDRRNPEYVAAAQRAGFRCCIAARCSRVCLRTAAASRSAERTARRRRRR